MAADVAALIVLVLLVRRLKGRAAEIRSKRQEKERIRRESEPFAWEQTRKTLRSGDRHRAYEAVVRWLEKLEPGIGSHRFAVLFGDADLANELDALTRSLYAGATESANLGKIAHKLSVARNRCLNERKEALDGALPPLNP